MKAKHTKEIDLLTCNAYSNEKLADLSEVLNLDKSIIIKKQISVLSDK